MHLTSLALVALAISAGSALAVQQDAQGPLPRLTLQDGQTLQLPPGTPDFGLSGSAPVAPAKPPADRAPSADQAPDAGQPPSTEQTPDTHVSAAQRRHDRLDELLGRLAKATDPAEAGALMLMIDHLWLESGSDTANLLMSRAVGAMTGQNYKLAAQLLDKIIALKPDWAEAWNKRATVRYLGNDDMASMQDIGHVLLLEPRHFGALSGMGFILHRNGEDKAALTVLRRAVTVNPQNPEVKSLIDQLTPVVEGHDL